MRCCSALSNGRKDTLTNRVHRYRGVLFIILALISLVLLLMSYSPTAKKVDPQDSAARPKKYAIVFDAESSSSRVHVFCFDANLDLIHLGREINLFIKVKNQRPLLPIGFGSASFLREEVIYCCLSIFSS
jgi:apyrase